MGENGDSTEKRRPIFFGKNRQKVGDFNRTVGVRPISPRRLTFGIPGSPGEGEPGKEGGE